MQALRLCVPTILLMVTLATIPSPALAGCNSASTTSTNSIIISPKCVESASGYTLGDITLSSAAGLLAGSNPCILAILAFLASSVLAGTGCRRDIMAIVAFFTLGMLAVYIIFGAGLFRVLGEKSTSAIFRSLLVAVLLILGLMQLEDARRLQRGGTSLFRTDWTKKYVQGIIASRNPSLYFLLGALFSLVRAPCVGGTYIAIIGMVSGQGYASSGMLYLMIYNTGIALPVLLLGGFIALGMSPEQVDRFRSNHRVAIRLITGFTLIAMTPLINWQMI